MRPLSASRSRALVAAFGQRKVLVLGDVMLDEFVWGRVARVSPEAPVPVVEVTGESFHAGGAANVAANVRDLGGRAILVGVVGEDDAGRRIRAALTEAGVEADLTAVPGRRTTVKTRIVAHHQQIVRADREDTAELSPQSVSAVEQCLRRAVPECAALIVSDYQKGVVSPALMGWLLPFARRRGVPVLVDPKVRHFPLFRRVRVITPNQAEAEQATGVPIRSEADLHEAGRRILSTLGCDAALITRGEHGMSLFERGRRPVHIPTAAREVFDVTGAGDTVVATLSLALAAGARLSEAAALANHAAGVVVGKVGTATATARELLDSFA
jgi:rfaE bifunctional protein kinase chain/domain